MCVSDGFCLCNLSPFKHKLNLSISVFVSYMYGYGLHGLACKYVHKWNFWLSNHNPHVQYVYIDSWAGVLTPIGQIIPILHGLEDAIIALNSLIWPDMLPCYRDITPLSNHHTVMSVIQSIFKILKLTSSNISFKNCNEHRTASKHRNIRNAVGMSTL